LAAIDIYGQVVLTENSLPVKIAGLTSSSGDGNTSQAQIVVKKDYYLPKNGIYEIRDIELANAEYGRTYKVRFEFAVQNTITTAS
jgi:hypothetical protein